MIVSENGRTILQGILQADILSVKIGFAGDKFLVSLCVVDEMNMIQHIVIERNNIFYSEDISVYLESILKKHNWDLRSLFLKSMQTEFFKNQNSQNRLLQVY